MLSRKHVALHLCSCNLKSSRASPSCLCAGHVIELHDVDAVLLMIMVGCYGMGSLTRVRGHNWSRGRGRGRAHSLVAVEIEGTLEHVRVYKPFQNCSCCLLIAGGDSVIITTHRLTAVDICNC